LEFHSEILLVYWQREKHENETIGISCWYSSQVLAEGRKIRMKSTGISLH
jgi:hypothetical protein